MIALAIDASTYRGTVAVLRNGALAATAEAAMRGAHTEGLMPAVASVLATAGVSRATVDRVICGGGPGSFTSLRIAASIAKGIALGAGAPLYAVSSLALILAASDAPAGKYVVTLDALRDQWYAAVCVRRPGGTVDEVEPAMLVARADLDQFASSIGAMVIGAARGAARGAAEPHASGCVWLGDMIERSQPVDLDRWEPAYGRLAEAQVKWEAAHGRPLGARP
jgi:tRNA threonylcarbamoyladenosine biosynthesis protein TsaB